MNSLQVGLAVAGGLILGAIVAYNTWSARRNEPRRVRRPQEGILESVSERREPSLDAHPLGQRPEAPNDEDTEDAPAWPGGMLAARNQRLDVLIDVVAPLALDGREVSGDALLAALPATRRVGSKTFAIEARATGAAADWEFPQPGQRYVALQAGVQLANRSGALNQIEFSEFVMKTQQFADAVGAAPEFPDMQHEVERARELDLFASEHDAQLNFMLRARQTAWSPGYVQQHAARHGLVPGSLPGRMVLPATQPGLPPLLTLVWDVQASMADDPEQAVLADVALVLDVTQVSRHEQPLLRLRELANALCESLDGVLCDQGGSPLPARALESIAAELEHLYDQLDVRELSAGSALARRLFS